MGVCHLMNPRVSPVKDLPTGIAFRVNDDAKEPFPDVNWGEVLLKFVQHVTPLTGERFGCVNHKA